jgi:hypothetical protein
MEKNDSSGTRDLIIQAAIESIPYVGAALSTLYFGRKQEKRFKRLESFYQEISQEINATKEKLADVSDQDPDSLSALLEELNEKVEGEHTKIKRECYKQYFKNTLKFPVTNNFDERKLILDTLAALTPLQLEIVAFLAGQKDKALSRVINKQGIDPALIHGLVSSLKVYGIIDSQFAYMKLAGPDTKTDEYIWLSDFGKKFHQFCMQ